MKRRNKLFTKLAVVAAFSCVALSPLSALAANAKFIVKDAAGVNNVFTVMDDGSFISNGATFQSAANGFLTILNASPGGAGQASAIRVLGRKQTATQFKLLTVDNAGNVGGGGFALMHNNFNAALTYDPTNIASYQFPVSGDRLGYMNIGSVDPATGNNRWGAGLVAFATGSWSIDGQNVLHAPTKLTFKTAGAAGDMTDKMTITPEGGIQLTPNQAGQPTCDAASRGVIWFVNGGAGADHLQVCAFDGALYSWKLVF